MGNCQTANAAHERPNTGLAIQKQDSKGDSASDTHMVSEDAANNSGDDGHHNGAAAKAVKFSESKENVPPLEKKKTGKELKKESWKNRPGYSSGASSDNFDDSYVFSGEDESPRDESSSRLAADPLHLRSMRDLMSGDLTQAVVRMETPFGKPIEDIYDGVHDGAYLGEGVSGIVRLVKHRATGVQYACKILDIGPINTEVGLRQLRDEISIMCQLDHPNIVRIEEVYESTNTIYLLQELCLGGDLFDRLEDQSDYHYSEAQCARLMKQMVSAVRYLHSKGVIHRDLKLENFLFSSTSPNSDLKMIDFGLSKHYDFGDVQTDPVGTPYTCAPEVIKGSYGEKCDIWSLGVITYLLLSGETPFGGCYDDDKMTDVRDKILSGSFSFEPEDIWEHASDLSKKFVKRLLNPNPKKRPTAKEVQRDEWLQVYASKVDDGSCEGNRLSPRIVDALVGFKEYSEMRRLLHEVLSFTLLPEQIVELREEFRKIDSDGDGEITLPAMKQVLMDSAGAGALGGLTEDEVEDIFNALRVNKNDATIRWHEFIAAGLSQCKVDDRNLRLAFDRFDTDRKGYISFHDLTDLLGHSPERLESLKKLWEESMDQCDCKLERISYDDFLILMKGQTKRERKRPSMVWSPQSALHPSGNTRAGIDGVSMAFPIPEEESDESKSNAGVEKDSFKNKFLRKRSKSFDDISLESNKSGSEGNMPRRISFPPRVRPSLAADGDFVRVIANQVKAPLLATRQQYLKHRDLRLALMQASKDFDAKCEIRRATTLGNQLGSPVQGAGLIMKRGSCAPPDLEIAHQRALVDAAVRRGGRHAHEKTHRRKRTQSDVTGMILSDPASLV